MTRKDYVLLAQALNDARPMAHWDANKRTQWVMDVKYIAQALSNDNNRFDYDRFIDACEKDMTNA